MCSLEVTESKIGRIYPALTVDGCDNKLSHKRGPTKLPFILINWGKISFNLHLILVSGNWALRIR